MRWRLVLAVTAVGLAARLATAHVAPSVDDNNRYLKLTPQGDRLRLAYTVFFGEVPGAGMRPAIDANHDRTISDAEAAAFGAKIAGEVASSIELVIDQRPVKVTWETVAVGMGAPQVAAGAFSVDLVAYLCLATPRGAHAVQLHDRFKLLRPGETEVRVEDAPGIAIARARIGGLEDPTHDYRFAGVSPLADDGLDLAFVTSDRAPLTGACQARAGQGISSGGLGLLLGVGVLGVAVLLVVGVRRSRARARQP